MSVGNSQVHIPFRAGADLSAASNALKFVKVTGESEVGLAGAGEKAIGVLQNRPQQGEGADVVVGGRTEVIAGAAVNDGDFVTSDAQGRAVAATAGATRVHGIALTTATAAGQVIDILVIHSVVGGAAT